MLEDLTPPVRQTPCKARAILNTLNDKDRAILESALDDAVLWQANTLANSLKARGVDLGQESIRRHRTKACSCLKISNQQ